ncbi:DNA repair protein RadC [Candidatus Dojkabacteria bacterium]|nr:DNA repair protein RadC [Candidatus Dojkabacteria bacterium]
MIRFSKMKYDLSDNDEEAIEQKPREKLVAYGPDVLTNAELLATIFITGTRQEGVLDLSARCLKEYGSRSITNIKDVGKVQEILGLGNAKACQLIALFEIGRRFFKETNDRMPVIRDGEDVYKLFKHMSRLKREELRAVYLNTRQRIVHEELISIGGADAINTSVKNILQPAVELLAKRVILIHNHPTGDLEPSLQDKRFTQKVRIACELLDIELLDHIVIGDGWKRII